VAKFIVHYFSSP